MDIEIMYEGGRRGRVPIADAATLRRDGVLFIILSAPTTERKARIYIEGTPYRRVREVSGLDNYALLTVNGYHLLWGWDNNTYAWVDASAPFIDYSLPDPRDPNYDTYRSWPPWLPKDALIFEGALVSAEKWKAAQAEFISDMH